MPIWQPIMGAVQNHVAQNHVAQSHAVLSHVAQNHVAQSHAVLSHVVQSHAVLSHVAQNHVHVLSLAAKLAKSLFADAVISVDHAAVATVTETAMVMKMAKWLTVRNDQRLLLSNQLQHLLHLNNHLHQEAIIKSS